MERGQADLAREVRALAAELRADDAGSGELLTTGEAARLLGVRSVFTIRRWAQAGILDGYRRGGRILISRASVERLRGAPTVAEARAREETLAADLEPLDAGDRPVPPVSWPGRKPWGSGVSP